jgi:hypothetical protein
MACRARGGWSGGDARRRGGASLGAERQQPRRRRGGRRVVPREKGAHARHLARQLRPALARASRRRGQRGGGALARGGRDRWCPWKSATLLGRATPPDASPGSAGPPAVSNAASAASARAARPASAAAWARLTNPAPEHESPSAITRRITASASSSLPPARAPRRERRAPRAPRRRSAPALQARRAGRDGAGRTAGPG